MTQYSYSKTTGTGATNIFVLPFPYIAQTDIHCYVNGVEVFGFTFPTAGSIQLTQSAGSLLNLPVMVRRITAGTIPDVTFLAGGVSPNDLNLTTQQVLYMAQEALDGVNLDNTGNMSAANLRIENVADPVNNQDVATKNYITSQIGSNLLAINGVGPAVAAAAAASAAAAVTAAAAQTATTFASLSGAVAFTGGTMNGVVIGNTAPAAGSFTTLSASGAATFGSTLSVTGDVTLGSVGFLLLPKGNTAQRPASPIVGQIRYNTDLATFEGYGATGWGAIGGAAAASVIAIGNVQPSGRLTLVSGDPTNFTAQAAKGTVYYTPYLGSNLPLWNGSGFTNTPFTELSNLLSDATTNPLAASPNAVYDLFAWSNSGSIVLSRGDMWSKISPSPSSTVTITIATPGVISWTAHGLTAGQPVQFTTSGLLPTGITAGTTYYVISAGLTTNSFEISATSGGTAVNTTGSQAGTHTATASAAISTASPALVTMMAHALTVGCPVRFSSTGSLPTGLLPNTTYFVIAAGLSTNTFEVSATVGGAAVNTTVAGTGTVTVQAGTGGTVVSNGAAGTANRGISGVNSVQGISVNSNPITNGPAAGYGTRVGTMMTDAAGATVSMTLGGVAAGGVAAWCGIWNTYNRITGVWNIQDSTASYVISFNSSFGQYGTGGVTKVSYVCGDAAEEVTSVFDVMSNVATLGNNAIGIGHDKTTTTDSPADFNNGSVTASGYCPMRSILHDLQKLGSASITPLFVADGAHSSTFQGGSGVLGTMPATPKMVFETALRF